MLKFTACASLLGLKEQNQRLFMEKTKNHLIVMYAQNVMVDFTITAWQKLEKRFQNEIMIGFVQITRFQLRTISWHHEMYVNTCTSDNFLTILLLHCHEHKELLNNIGLNDVELAFKSGIKLMLQNNIHKGKTVVLDYFKTKLNLERNGTKYNCFGSEYEMCLKLFCHVWKLYITLN